MPKLIICNKCKQLKYVSAGETVCKDCKIKQYELQKEGRKEIEKIDKNPP